MRLWLFVAVSCLTLSLPGCLLFRGRPSLPVGGSIVRDQLVIYSDFELPRRHRLIDDLVNLRNDVSQSLQLPTSDEPIHVYLFDAARPYRAFMQQHYPDFVDRRAFFVKDDTTLTVYAYWGDHVAEDLRHEVSHGYLHSSLSNLPLWLDEGLAEYFEVPRGKRGVNIDHVDLLWQQFRRDEWTPDLIRLEQLEDAAEMTQIDYAESWLWVHLFMQSTPERLAVLQQNLRQLKVTGAASPLSTFVDQSESSSERTLIQHLKSVRPK